MSEMSEEAWLKRESKPTLWSLVKQHADNLHVNIGIAIPLIRPRATIELHAIQVPPVRGLATLAAALHELGHHAVATKEKQAKRLIYEFLGPDKEKELTKLTFDEECLAWTWAKHNCPLWDSSMSLFAKNALLTHKYRKNKELGKPCAKFVTHAIDAELVGIKTPGNNMTYEKGESFKSYPDLR